MSRMLCDPNEVGGPRSGEMAVGAASYREKRCAVILWSPGYSLRC